MEWIIFCIVSITAIIFIALFLLSRWEIKNIYDQLSIINRNRSNAKVLLSSSNKGLGRLTEEINRTLGKKQRIEIEYKRMDTELRQAIANMSHDLRTPLTSIMGYLQLIEDNNMPEEEKKQYIEIVKKRAELLQTMIVGLYDMSRLESGEYKFDFRVLNISNILCDIIASFYNDFLGREIEPVIDIDEKAASVIADENGVRRVFFNLIQNMLKYGRRFVLISLKRDENNIITIFQNDAPDLNEEDVPRLFERFFIADRTRSGNNTGLGLSIAKQLVEQMGHEITAELMDGKLSIIIKWKK